MLLHMKRKYPYKHGMHGTPEYKTWAAIIQRCNNPKNPKYSYYGGKGITVCKRWLTFENFLTDIGLRPSVQHTIDRFPNGEGNYEPKNCRWATKKQQAQNRHNVHQITFNGETHCIAEWTRKLNLSKDLIRRRLFMLGWSIERALTTPSQIKNGRKPNRS